MDNNEIIDYVIQTPSNSNPNVMRGILEKSSGGDSRWEKVDFSDIGFTFDDNTDWVIYKQVWLNTSIRMITITMTMETGQYDPMTVNTRIGSFSDDSEYLPLQVKDGEMFMEVFSYDDRTSDETKYGQIYIDWDGNLELNTLPTFAEGHSFAINFTLMYVY